MNQTHHAPSLEAKSPFDLRVNLGEGVPESDVRTALATGDMGFLTFVHDWLDRRRARCARSWVDLGLPLALPLLP